jgi:hypothetical protein
LRALLSAILKQPRNGQLAALTDRGTASDRRDRSRATRCRQNS